MALCLDTHCHLDALEFASDRQDVIDRAKSTGVSGVLIPGVKAAEFNQVIDLCHRSATTLPGNCYALGIHPLYTPQASLGDLSLLKDAIANSISDPRFVGVGEIGLDYFVPELDRSKQELFFHEQLKIAQEFQLPVIMHVRRSQDAIVQSLKKFPVISGIAHAFNGSFQQAEQFMALNCVMGFGGAMTYPRALQIRRLAAELPIESIVLETDAPDIPPIWLSGDQRRNEPSELPQIASVLSELRHDLISRLQDQCSRNALRVIPRWGTLLQNLSII
jgi:TatD DNase family protein